MNQPQQYQTVPQTAQPQMQVMAVNGQPVSGMPQPAYPANPQQQYLPPFSSVISGVETHASKIPWYVWLGVGVWIGAKYLKW